MQGEKAGFKSRFSRVLQKSLLLILLSGVCSLQLALDISQAKAQKTYEMTVQTAPQAQLDLHAIVFISRKVGKKKPNIIQNTVYGRLAVMAV